MRLLEQLERWKLRGQINQPIIDIVFMLRERLEKHWRADVHSPLVNMLLFHIACSLGRIERGGCASPLHQEMFKELQSAIIFPTICSHSFLLIYLKRNKAISWRTCIRFCWNSRKFLNLTTAIGLIKQQL